MDLQGFIETEPRTDGKTDARQKVFKTNKQISKRKKASQTDTQSITVKKTLQHFHPDCVRCISATQQ